jgi:uncharacterized membrane protein YdjX (TVP38/TMEM64 family)
MPSKATANKFKISIILTLIVFCFVVFWFRIPIWEKITDLYRLFSDREKIRLLISSFGGEATGFIGGYLFGTLPGFIYSSIGLTVGSWLNFVIGRFLGERYVRKRIPARQFQRIDGLVKRQGVVILFILFLFPGFPKDYLCLVLGVSTLPMKIFILLAGIGRMPGTLALSLQGEFLYEQNYLLLGVMIAVCLILALLCYGYREKIYLWIEKMEKNN